MSPHWTLRWLAMLVLFAICTLGFSAYASATPEASPPDEETEVDDASSETEDSTTDDASQNSEQNQDRNYSRQDNQVQSQEYMLTITRSAFLGALLGTLIGGSIFVLSGRQMSPWVIGYSAAGGVFLGTLIGTIDIASRESRARHSLDTFDDDLHEERERRIGSDPTLPLLRLDF